MNSSAQPGFVLAAILVMAPIAFGVISQANRGCTQEAPLVWIAARNAGSIVAVSPETLQPVAEITPPGEGSPEGLAVSESAVWVAGSSGWVSRIDPATRTISASGRSLSFSDRVTAAEGDVWVGNGDLAWVTRLDPASASAVDSVEVGWWVLDLAIAEGALWIASDGNAGGQLSRIPLGASDITDIRELDWRPEALAVGEGALWAHDSGSGAVHRIDPGSGTQICTGKTTYLP